MSADNHYKLGINVQLTNYKYHILKAKK